MTTLNVPNVTKLAGYAQIAVGIAVLIGLYTVIRKLQFGAGEAGKSFGEFFYSFGRVENLGEVLLPSGERIAIDDIVQSGSMVDSKNRFNWRGQRYELERSGEGYTARRI